MELSTTIHIDAPPADVWGVLADVSTWPRWTSSVRSVEPITDGPLAVGKRVRMHQPQVAPMTWTVTALDPPRCFTWQSRAPGVRVVARHVLHPERDGTTTVDLSVQQTGVLSPLFRLLTSRVTDRYLHTEAEELRHASEQPLAVEPYPVVEPSRDGRPSRPGSPNPRRGPVHTALWVDAGLLAGVFALSSSAKLFVPKEKLAQVPLGGWTEDAGAGVVKALGALEALAAVGLILPPAVDIAPVLVPIDAIGLVLLMIGAATTHLRRHEPVGVALNLTYLAMAAFVAWGRFGAHSFRE
jgi:uncharacterized protein YndB with AHSA1/START domain